MRRRARHRRLGLDGVRKTVRGSCGVTKAAMDKSSAGGDTRNVHGSRRDYVRRLVPSVWGSHVSDEDACYTRVKEEEEKRSVIPLSRVSYVMSMIMA